MKQALKRLILLSNILLVALLLPGCQTVPADVQQLQGQLQSLEGELQKSEQKNQVLEARKAELDREVSKLNGIITVLGGEKSSREQESSQLRGQVRTFVQEHIDRLKDFLVLGDLLDYIGGELVERKGMEDDKGRLLVDLDNAVPRSGSITAVGAYFMRPGAFSIKVMRPVDDKLIVIWSSSNLVAREVGLQKLKLPITIGVEKGDVLAYYFPTGVTVGFDTGTGDTRNLEGDVAVSAMLKRRSLLGEKDRKAYSIGVYGLLH